MGSILPQKILKSGVPDWLKMHLPTPGLHSHRILVKLRSKRSSHETTEIQRISVIYINPATILTIIFAYLDMTMKL